MRPTTEIGTQIEKDSWEQDRRYMTSNLVRLLHHRMCWADKMDIVKAIHEIELDFEDHITEQNHLHGSTNEPQRGE